MIRRFLSPSVRVNGFWFRVEKNGMEMMVAGTILYIDHILKSYTILYKLLYISYINMIYILLYIIIYYYSYWLWIIPKIDNQLAASMFHRLFIGHRSSIPRHPMTFKNWINQAPTMAQMLGFLLFSMVPIPWFFFGFGSELPRTAQLFMRFLCCSWCFFIFLKPY